MDILIKNHKKIIKNDRFVLESQQIFRSEKINLFTEEGNHIALSTKDNKRIHSIETYAYRTSKDKTLIYIYEIK